MAKMDNVPEDVRGDIRSAIGKAQLLMNQRFHQFSGLIEQCRLGLGEKRTHTTDLQGFWDMVYFQIEDVNKMFANLSTLRENNWQQKDGEVIPQVTKKVVKKKVVKQTDQRLGQKKAARERLAAIKAALKEKENKEKEKVLFDAGFFHVESPVKEKQIHCAAGSSAPSSPLKRKSFTPRLPGKRLSLVGKEQDLLRAVLQASHTPKMNEVVPAPVNSTSIFTPEQEASSTQKDDMVTRLQDLGLSSGRKRRRSQRIKSKEDAAELGEEEQGTRMEINDLSSYLMPSVPVVDLNSQAEEMMRTEPADQLRDLGKRTPFQTER
ncbi:putative microtubule-associated protein futsch-like isoform X4 [Apostichopus japonicus]|uniref:Putative microtubule-associated protein futsch-like isoform X4 n=1 Tax=Stichopus japonicus TaxID=307972 RepID=A0A2G8KRJ5_STIJA|nr:putative microtubule-associated protein futsch-like isoform X4 [Apostichopus japonicus]